MFALGHTNVDIAAACGVSLSGVKAWKRAWREGGEAALAVRPHPGPEPRLSLENLEQLERALLSGAKKAGFDSDLWTCARVAEVIEQRFGVSYPRSSKESSSKTASPSPKPPPNSTRPSTTIDNSSRRSG
jgi:transposase